MRLTRWTLPPLTASALAALDLPADGVLVLQGADGRFSTGMDLEAGLDDGRERVRAFAELLGWLDRRPGPVVALVDGKALGGGAGLAAVADWVIAGPRARFALPEALLGLVPGVVFPYLARRMGPAVVRRMALGGPTLEPEEALAAGLVDVVDEDPESALADVVLRLQRLEPGAVASLREYAAGGWGPGPAVLEEAIARFGDRVASDATRRRVRIWQEGGAPWLEEAP